MAEHARASIDTFLVDGSDAVLMGHISGTVRMTGKSFDGPFALHLTVVEGRITRHRLYENSLSIAEACTL